MKTYEECAAAGLTKAETARALGVTAAAVSRYAKKHKLEFVAYGHKRDSARPYRECAEAGLTQAQTAAKLGVTRASVSNMAARHNLKFKDGRRVPFMGFDSILAASKALGKNYSTVWYYQPGKERKKK